MSLVDDLIMEPIREYYCRQHNLYYSKIPELAEDGRAKRITAYLNTVNDVVRIKMDSIKKQSFFKDNDKAKYFRMLPDDTHLKMDYLKLLDMKPCLERDELAESLTDSMHPGSIDVNIMVKLDTVRYDEQGNPLGDEFSDAKAALRGYANSNLKSSIVLSAGINQPLFTYMTLFRDFYRDKLGNIKKKIILKVSDFRSTLTQGKFLARKGLEVHEFRIESGLNCGGHAFASNGFLLPTLLQEFKENRDALYSSFLPLVRKYYEKKDWKFPDAKAISPPLLTVQGGIGTHGEVRRMMDFFGMEMTGWATPFLLVPEATPVDDTTRELLKQAGEKDFLLSDISPLRIPFNNVKGTGLEKWTRQRSEQGWPGSTCPKRFLVSNTEYTRIPICLASRDYQNQKLMDIEKSPITDEEKQELKNKTTEKSCICHHLGSGALISLGLAKESESPQAICPGPNLAWFNRTYTLEEMIDHIYGRRTSLVPENRPHMFAKEIVMYVDYYEKLVNNCTFAERGVKTLKEYKVNLEKGMDLCLQIAEKPAYPGENLASIPPCVAEQQERLNTIYTRFLKQSQAATA
jgi:hypothetical protein